MASLGALGTRLDEDTCLIPMSFECVHEIKEWEGLALVLWAVSLTPGGRERQIEDDILDEFRLHRGEVVISKHSCEPFLVKFENKKHYNTMTKKKKIK